MELLKTAEASIEAEYKGYPIKIVGESFNSPVKKTQEKEFRTTIDFYVSGVKSNRTIYFEAEFSQELLNKQVILLHDKLEQVFENG